MMNTSPPLVLVTGASSGIGRAVARQLSQSSRLLLHGRDAARLEETRQLCLAPERHLCWQCDFREVAGIAPSLQAVLDREACGVSQLVHCAGMVTILPARMITPEAVNTIFAVNFIAATELCATLLKKKVNAQHLCGIVFVSSIWSNFGARGYSLYCASKGALDAFMRALAVELAPRIRVNSVLPGVVPSRMAEEGLADEVIRAKLASDYPLGSGHPEDIAEMVEFLLSERAQWITGQQFIVDGGRTANMSLK